MMTDNDRFTDELPSNCRSQMETMENAVRAEDFHVASLSGEPCRKIQELEGRLSQDLGRRISLVAYEDSHR